MLNMSVVQSVPGQAQPPQMSPDGRWWWDGTRWVPIPPGGGYSQRPQQRRGWIWWIAGGCLMLVIGGIVLVVMVGGTLLNNFQHGAYSCLPSDFPAYQGATVNREYTYVGTNVAPGDSSECQMVLESNDSVDSVASYYTAQLAEGDWKITANDPTTGVIQFARVSRPATVGTIELLGRGQHSEIDIRLDS